ncbi:hypothetical protein ACLOJK_037402 [Asimina triloba]
MYVPPPLGADRKELDAAAPRVYQSWKGSNLELSSQSLFSGGSLYLVLETLKIAPGICSLRDAARVSYCRNDELRKVCLAQARLLRLKMRL